MDYFIVLKGVYEKEILEELFQSTKVLCTFEKPDVNPHYHIIGKFEESHSALTQRIKRFLNLGRNKLQCSAGYKESETAAAIYILKEKRVIFNTLFDEHQIDDFMSRTLQVNKEKFSDKRKSYSDRLVDEYVQPELHNDTWLQEDDHILNYIVKNYKGAYGLKQSTEIYYGILSKTDPEAMVEILKKKIYTRSNHYLNG